MDEKTKKINAWFKITLANETNKLTTNEVELYDEIGYDGYDYGVTLTNFKQAVDKLDNYKMRIHSPGGYVDTGLAIYDYNKLRVENGANVEVQIDGTCASIATIIALSGSELPTATENASVMIHAVSGGAYGNIKDMEDAAEHMKVSQDKIANIYMTELGWDADYVDELLTNGKDNYFHGDDIVDIGFASTILATTKKASNLKNCWDKTKMSNKYNYKPVNKTQGDDMDDVDNNGKGKRALPTTDDTLVNVVGANLSITAKLEEANKATIALQAKLDGEVAKNGILTTEKSVLETAAETAAVKTAEVAKALRVEELTAMSKEKFHKLGKETDVASILMDVETNCSAESFTKVTDLLTRANAAITFDIETGNGDDGEVNESKWRSERQTELVAKGATAFDALKQVNREWLTKQNSNKDNGEA